jgi:WD40 repeat protein
MAYDPQRQEREREAARDEEPAGEAGARSDWPVVPGYDLLRRLGAGPLGEVYKARQTAGGRSVALRVLRLGDNVPAQEQRRLLAIAESLVAMQHPNIAAMYASGEWSGGLYFATELIEGESLAAKIGGIPQPERQAAELVETLAQAIQFCHDRQILHRNLKPANILLTGNDVPKVVDFGLTPEQDGGPTETLAGMVGGTAAYITPEQAAGGTGVTGPATDVHALGVILYEMLTGRPPFLGESAAEAIRNVKEQEAISPRTLRPTISAQLEAICLKCLQKSPQRRYGTCKELAADLRRFLDGEAIEAQSPGSVLNFWQWCQEKPMVVGAGVGVAVLIVGAVFLGMFRSPAGKSDSKQFVGQVVQDNRPEPPQAKPTTEAPFGQNQGPRDPGRELDELRRRYAADIRQAKQAWDRGNVATVRQLLEPYRTDPQKQGLRTFAWHYLWRGAVSDAVLALRGHAKPIRQAAFAYDDKYVITLSDDGMLVVWDAVKGDRLQAVALDSGAAAGKSYFAQQTTQSAAGLVTDPDDNWWFAAYGKAVWTGSLRQSGQPRRIESPVAIISMAMSLDGKTLATGDEQGQITVRQLPEGSIVRQWKDAPARAMAFSRDGRTLWVGTQYGMLSSWEVSSGAVLSSDSFSHAINSLAIARDGQTVAVAVADREGVVRLWEPAVRRVRAELRGHQDEVTHVVFSPEGNRLLTSSRDQTARLWNTSGSLVRTFKGHTGEVETAIFSDKGHQIITAGADRLAILWNASGNQEYEVVAGTPAMGRINSLSFSLGGEQLFAAGCGEGTAAFLSAWNLADVTQPHPLQVAATDGTAMGFSPDGRFVAIGETESIDANTASRVRVWDLESGRTSATIAGLTGRIRSVGYSPDGRIIAASMGDRDERIPGEVRFWDTATGALRSTLSKLNGRVEAAFIPDSKLIVTVSESKKRLGEIRLWNSETGEAVGQIEKAKELENLNTMALSPDGKFLVTAHGDVQDASSKIAVKMNLWDLEKRQWVATFPPGHSSGIMRLVFSRRGMLLASGDMAGNVRIWDFPSRKLLPAQIREAAPADTRIVALAFDRLGDRLVTGAAEAQLRIWNVDTAAELARLQLTRGTPNVVRFTPDGTTLLATTTAGGLIAWDAQSYRVRAVLQAEGTASVYDGHRGEVSATALTATGELVTGGADKVVRRWDLKESKPTTDFPASHPISCLAISPNGRQMAVGTGKYKTSFEPGELVLCPFPASKDSPAPQVIASTVTPINVAFAPDGNTLVATVLSQDSLRGYSQNVLIVNLSSGKTSTLNNGKPLSLAVSADGRLLAVGHSTGEIEVWTLDSFSGTSANPIKTLSRHEGPVAAVGFSPDGTTLVSGGYDRNVKVWDLATGEELLVFKHNGTIDAVRFSPDGKTLATADHLELQNSIRLWRTTTENR